MFARISRRHFLKAGSLTLGACMAGGLVPAAATAAEAASNGKAQVFFTRDLSAGGLCRIYERVAAPLLQSMAADIAASENLDDPLQLPAPGLNVVRLPVCADTGDLDTSLCRDTVETWFIPGVSPIRPTGIYRTILVDTRTGLRACSPEDPHVEMRIQEFWPSELAAMFAAAGIARTPPPPLDPRCSPEGTLPGAAPVILRPKAGLIYHLRPEAPRRTLLLQAHADAGIRTLHWFADGRLIGRSAPGETLEWETGPGTYLLRVVDDAGRAVTRRVIVRMLPRSD